MNEQFQNPQTGEPVVCASGTTIANSAEAQTNRVGCALRARSADVEGRAEADYSHVGQSGDCVGANADAPNSSLSTLNSQLSSAVGERRPGSARHGVGGERQPASNMGFMQYREPSAAPFSALPGLRSPTAAVGGSSAKLSAANCPLSTAPGSRYAEHRASLVREWRALQTAEDGQPPMASSAAEAAKMLGQSHASLLRWSRQLDAGGVAALEPGYGRCGRKPMATMTADEQLAVQLLVMRAATNTGCKISTSLALRSFARLDGVELTDGRVVVCSETLREAILKPRKSKHTITQHLKRQARVTPEMLMLHRGEKTFETHAYSQPRDNTVLDVDGSRRPLRGGDLREWDDMHFNKGFYVPWDDPADPCAALFGVRPFRAQLLASADVGTHRLGNFGIIARYNDSYRQEDILWTFLRDLQADGIPRLGQRLELGSWNGKLVNKLGSIASVDDVGRAIANVCPITHTWTPKGKTIEGLFNTLQKVMALRGVNLGRKRGEFERENRDWTRARTGKVHPKDVGYLPLHEMVEHVAAAITFMNGDAVEGDVFRGVPDELYARDISAAPLARLTDEQAMWLMPQQGIARIEGAMINAKVVALKSRVYFHAPEFARLGSGYKLYYHFDHADLEAGCIVRNREEGARAKFRPDDPTLQRSSTPFSPGEIICRAGYVERVPQFSLAVSRDDESIARRRRFAQQCRLMFRQVMPFGLGKAARVEERRDGRGGVQRIQISTNTTRHAVATGEVRGREASIRTADPVAPLEFTRGTEASADDSAASRLCPPNSPVPRATVSRRQSRWELLGQAST